MPHHRRPFAPPPETITGAKAPPLRNGTFPNVPKIDFKGYFLRFCHQHGEPELVGNRLVFRDGWTYPVRDYAGPESPPPANTGELDSLVTKYWQSRHARCAQALAKAIAVRDRIEAVQRQYSLPLQQTKIEKQGDGTYRHGSVTLSTADVDRKIQWLRADVGEAERALAEITTFYKGKQDGK